MKQEPNCQEKTLYSNRETSGTINKTNRLINIVEKCIVKARQSNKPLIEAELSKLKSKLEVEVK